MQFAVCDIFSLKSIRSVETAIITGRGSDTPPDQKFLDTNLQNITRDISEYHKSVDEAYAFCNAVQLQVQGQWTRWVNYVQQDFS